MLSSSDWPIQRSIVIEHNNFLCVVPPSLPTQYTLSVNLQCTINKKPSKCQILQQQQQKGQKQFVAPQIFLQHIPQIK